jgi:trehalose 6-phosphate phosphatase
MRLLLARENAEVLAQLARSRVLLAFDFDGTLAPIVARPTDAQMRKRTSELFMKVCGLYPCAVISGRSQADVAARLEHAEVKYVVGNHGVEPSPGQPEIAVDVERASDLLTRSLAHTSGIDIEDKRYSLSLHYRRARRKRATRSAIERAIGALPVPMRIVPGKLVVNVVPARAPNKGDALIGLRTSEHADIALYVGDDITDEDVFELDQPGRLLTVRIGASRSSAATYALRDQKDIDRLLARLVGLRQPQVSR